MRNLRNDFVGGEHVHACKDVRLDELFVFLGDGDLELEGGSLVKVAVLLLGCLVEVPARVDHRLQKTYRAQAHFFRLQGGSVRTRDL